MRGIGGEGGYHLQSSVRRASVYIPGPTLHKFDATFIFKMSALPPKADMDQQGRDVRFVPEADILRCSEERRCSITGGPRPKLGCASLARLHHEFLPTSTT